jgi:putative membrane protein
VLDILFAFAIGSALGIVAGLLPGLHPNNFLWVAGPLAAVLSPLPAAVAMVTSGIVNAVVSFIPAILLGAPESADVLSVLPGHKLLMEGRGLEAIKAAVSGAFWSSVLAVVALPVFALFIPAVYRAVRPQMHWILSAAALFLILTEEDWKSRGKALFIFLLSGLLGYLVLDYFTLQEPLLPMLSGLFGLPMLLVSCLQETHFPEMIELKQAKLPRRDLALGVGAGAISGVVAGLLPGLGASGAAALIQGEKTTPHRFLISLGAIATADVIYSLAALLLINNPRSGIAVAVGELIKIDATTLALLSAIAVAAALFGAFVSLKLARHALMWLRKVNYRALCAIVVVSIVMLVAVMSGPIGLIISSASLAVGLITNFSGVRRSHAMGCLMLPTILFFAGFR